MGAYLPIGKSDNRAAAFVLTQLLGFPSNHGLGKLSGRDAVTFFPELIRRMFDNLEFVAEWVHEPNRQLIGMRFTRKLLPRPDFDLTKLAKEVQGATGVDALPGNDGKYVEGGEVLFFAEGKIHNKTEGKIDTKIATEWLYLQIGFGLQISKGPSNTPGSRLVHPYLYTEFYGKNMNSEDTYKETGYLNAFPKEEHALSLFHKCLTKSRENALKNTSGATKAALHEFKVPPAP